MIWFFFSSYTFSDKRSNNTQWLNIECRWNNQNVQLDDRFVCTNIYWFDIYWHILAIEWCFIYANKPYFIRQFMHRCQCFKCLCLCVCRDHEVQNNRKHIENILFTYSLFLSSQFRIINKHKYSLLSLHEFLPCAYSQIKNKIYKHFMNRK